MIKCKGLDVAMQNKMTLVLTTTLSYLLFYLNCFHEIEDRQRSHLIENKSPKHLEIKIGDKK